MNTEHTAPQTAEDQYAEFVASTRETTAEPAQPAAEAAPEPQQAQPRDEGGRFAPKAGAPQTAAPAEKEPFEGFSALDASTQEKFRRMMDRADRAERERNSFRDRYSRAEQRIQNMSRQQPAGNGSGGNRPSQSQGSGRSAQPGIAQARAEVADMAPGAGRDQANRQLDAWEKHAREYPEDAAAITQLVGALRDDILSGVMPQLRELQDLREQVNGFRTVAEQFTHAQQEQERRGHRATLDEIAPGWDILTGHKTEDGQPVAEWKGLHPAFETWLDAHDPDVKADMLRQLANPSPYVAGNVIRGFLADWQATENDGQAAPAAPNAHRAANLRDVAPSGGGSAPTPAWNRGMSDEDAYAEFVRSERARQR